MPSYRLYRLSVGGHIQQGQDFLADDDLQAETFGRENAQGYAVEIWRLSRLVKRIPLPGDRSEMSGLRLAPA